MGSAVRCDAERRGPEAYNNNGWTDAAGTHGGEFLIISMLQVAGGSFCIHAIKVVQRSTEFFADIIES